MKYVEVARDSSQIRGPGKIRLMDDNDNVVGEWDCITGGDKLDPSQYGGVTPPISFSMVEAIEPRKHPKGHTMTMARIYPLDSDDIERYGNRTFSLDQWPFMIHAAGSSTGCIGVVQWKPARAAINQAWIENGGYLEITVTEV